MRGGLALILLVSVLPVLGVSCADNAGINQAADNLGNFLKQKVARPLSEQIKRAQDRTVNFTGSGPADFIKDLADKEKQAVEDWLSKNGLNRFGDEKGAVYAGGTPLFNEQTGESLNRYEYLFKKFPELKEIIKSAIKGKAAEKK